MTDYIKRAVELAEGFELQGEQETVAGTTAKFVRVPVGFLSVSWSTFLERPAYLDALAAQLVRQVDALDYAYFGTGGDRAACCGNGTGGLNRKGKDRTMNTIKAIIDSGVLE